MKRIELLNELYAEIALLDATNECLGPDDIEALECNTRRKLTNMKIITLIRLEIEHGKNT